MAERLVKIAKELNVGLSTIVEFLNSKGFEIEAKPTAMVSEEMHTVLLKEFNASMVEKEKADQIIIGSRLGGKEEEKPASKSIFIPKFSFDKPAATPEVEPKETPQQQPTTQEPEQKSEEIFAVTPEIHRPKVVGKIDLDKPKPQKQEEEQEQDQ